MVESKRIDIDALHDIIQQHLVSGGGHELDSLQAELKTMYAREAELLEALRIIRDDLDEEIAKAHFPNDKVAWQIRNFANDASQ